MVPAVQETTGFHGSPSTGWSARSGNVGSLWFLSALHPWVSRAGPLMCHSSPQHVDVLFPWTIQILLSPSIWKQRHIYSLLGNRDTEVQADFTAWGVMEISSAISISQDEQDKLIFQ